MYYDMDYDLEARYEDQWGDPERDFEEEAYNQALLDNPEDEAYDEDEPEGYYHYTDEDFEADHGLPPF